GRFARPARLEVKPIRARRQVGVLDAAALAELAPDGVEALEPRAIPDALGSEQVGRSERDRQPAAAGEEPHRPPRIDLLAVGLYRLDVELQRLVATGGKPGWFDDGHPAHRGEPQAAVARSQRDGAGEVAALVARHAVIAQPRRALHRSTAQQRGLG